MTMFRLPSLPSVPGISSDSPKLAFRSAPNGLARLCRQNIPREDTAYWKQYWELFDSAEEVNTLITTQHVRTAFQQFPENLRTLLSILMEQFIRVVRSPTFPRPVSSSFPLPLTPWSGVAAGDDSRTVLNCARVIARVLPVVWEDESGWSAWLWEDKEDEDTPDALNSGMPEPQFVIEDEEGDEDGNNDTSANPNTQVPAKKKAPSIMSQYLSALVDSLFHACFTLPSDTVEGSASRTAYVIWASGVGSSLTPAAPAPIPTNRSTILLVLLSILSRPLYATPLNVHQQPSPVIAQLASYPRKTYLALLCSLLNTALTPPSARYIGQVLHDEDVLPNRAAQVLLVLLCQDGYSPNVFQKAIAKLHREQDFDFLLDGIKGALEAEASKGGLVNGVAKAVPVGRRGNGPGLLETWLLTWRILDLNKKFTNHVLSSPHLPALTSHLFMTLTLYKDSPPHFALLRTLSYLLQTVTSHRTFAVALSSPLPHSTATRGSDAMVGAVYSVMAGTNGQHAGLYQPLLISLANIGPYVKSLSVQSANRLINLFQAFTNPQFLLAEEGNPRCVFWMLEFFTHVIHRQFSDNPNLIYAMLRTHERFQSLATFTLSSAKLEIERAKAAKEEHLRRTGASTPDPKKLHTPEQSRAQSPDGEAPEATGRDEKHRVRDKEDATATTTDQPTNIEISEKARGKLPEPIPSVSSLASPTIAVNTNSILGYESSTGFVATEEWVQSWVQGLPLDSIQVAVSELLPKIQKSKTSSSAAAAALASATLVGILPPALPVISRRFQWSDRSEVWRTSLLWGQIYVSSGPNQGPWAGTQIRLFGIKPAPLTRRDRAIVNMTNAVGNMWSAVGGHNKRSNTNHGRAASSGSRDNRDPGTPNEQGRTTNR